MGTVRQSGLTPRQPISSTTEAGGAEASDGPQTHLRVTEAEEVGADNDSSSANQRAEMRHGKDISKNTFSLIG